MKNLLLLSLITTVATSILSGCGSDDLPEFNRIEDLRVLALIANTPEASVGSTVTVTPVISDYNGRGRTLTYTAEACNDPGVGLGADPSCTGSASRVVLAQDAAVTGISAPDYTAAATSTISVTIPATAISGYNAITQAIGVPYLITYKLTAGDGATTTAFKRIIVSTKPIFGTTANNNPSVTNIMSNGAAVTSLPNDKIFIYPQFGAISAESYLSLQGDGSTLTKTEELITTWFISDGTTDSSRSIDSNSVGYTRPARLTDGRNVVIVAVTRDERGGTAFFKIAL